MTSSASNRNCVLIGVPYDAHSSFRRGCAAGPAAIREILSAGGMNLCSESGIDLGAGARLRDAGDLEIHTRPEAAGEAAGHDPVLDEIERTIAELIAEGDAVLAIGGDHAVTLPIVRAHARHHGPLDIVQFDAHPDLYDAFDGDRLSHACVMARIVEEGLAGRVVQIGVRAMNGHQREQAVRFGVEVLEMRNLRPDLTIALDGPAYITFDVDGLDPSAAPGVAHPESGGLSTREAISLIQGLDARVVGADIVELNPGRDVGGITAVVGAKLVKEITARLLEG